MSFFDELTDMQNDAKQYSEELWEFMDALDSKEFDRIDYDGGVFSLRSGSALPSDPGSVKIVSLYLSEIRGLLDRLYS